MFFEKASQLLPSEVALENGVLDRPQRSGLMRTLIKCVLIGTTAIGCLNIIGRQHLTLSLSLGESAVKSSGVNVVINQVRF